MRYNICIEIEKTNGRENMWAYPFDNVAESTELIAVAVELGVDYFVDMDDGNDDYTGTLWADLEQDNEHLKFMAVYEEIN